MEALASHAMVKGVEIAANQIYKKIELRQVEHLKEKIGGILAVAVELSDVEEKSVKDFLDKFLKTIPTKNDSLFGFPLLEVDNIEIALRVLTYGTFDEFTVDELEPLMDFSATEGEIIPTVSRITMFLCPLNLKSIDDILKLYRQLIKIDEGIRSQLTNLGSIKAVRIFMEKNNVFKLLEAVRIPAEKFNFRFNEFRDQNGHVGVEIINPSDLALQEILTAITKKFGGLLSRLKRS